MTTITEADVEQAALEWLSALVVQRFCIDG